MWLKHCLFGGHAGDFHWELAERREDGEAEIQELAQLFEQVCAANAAGQERLAQGEAEEHALHELLRQQVAAAPARRDHDPQQAMKDAFLREAEAQARALLRLQRELDHWRSVRLRLADLIAGELRPYLAESGALPAGSPEREATHV